MADVEIIEASREPLNFEQLRLLMGWSWGDQGLWAADLWMAFNESCWGGRLDPCPIWFPTASPYGHWIGLCTGNQAGQVQHIQVLRQLPEQQKANILLHEMIHQALVESGKKTKHNVEPWCGEIMRLSREIWGVEVWASPSVPRKRDGVSVRVQKRSPTGEESISRKAIAGWPDSLELSVPLNKFL